METVSEHVEILLYDLALVFSQLEQVVDCFVYVGFEVVDVRPFNLLAVGFESVKQLIISTLGTSQSSPQLRFVHLM